MVWSALESVNACPERPSTPDAWRLTLRVTGETPVRPERSEAKSKGAGVREERHKMARLQLLKTKTLDLRLDPRLRMSETSVKDDRKEENKNQFPLTPAPRQAQGRLSPTKRGKGVPLCLHSE